MEWKALLLVEYSKNRFSCEILDCKVSDDRNMVIEDIIYCEDQIFLVPESQLKDKILHAKHTSPLAGHLGYLKTYRQIQERFDWKGLKNDLLKFLPKFHIFQQNKVEHTHPVGLLQPLPIPEQKWEIIRWILSQGCLWFRGKIVFTWWLIGLLNSPIFSSYHPNNL
jgi:hypothetical protein